MNFGGRVVFAAPAGAAAHRSLGTNDGIASESVGSAADLGALLADRYDIALTVVDMGIADAALLDRLQAPGAPRAIFLLDQQYDAITIAPNVVAYLDVAAPAAAIREAILAALPAGPGVAVGDFSDRDAQRLNSLGREVERIARALSDIATPARISSSPRRSIPRLSAPSSSAGGSASAISPPSRSAIRPGTCCST